MQKESKNEWIYVYAELIHLSVNLKIIQHCKSTAAAGKSLQSCPTLCDPIDGSPPGSPIPGILQARTLEWVAISFSSAWKWKLKVKSLSRIWPSATPWTAAFQAPPSMGFSRQEYLSGVPLPSSCKSTILQQRKIFLVWALIDPGDFYLVTPLSQQEKLLKDSIISEGSSYQRLFWNGFQLI